MRRIKKHVSLVTGRPYWEIVAGGATVEVRKRYSREAGRELYMLGDVGFATLAAVVAWLESEA